jgi:hypothetical protein
MKIFDIYKLSSHFIIFLPIIEGICIENKHQGNSHEKDSSPENVNGNVDVTWMLTWMFFLVDTYTNKKVSFGMLLPEGNFFI